MTGNTPLVGDLMTSTGYQDRTPMGPADWPRSRFRQLTARLFRHQDALARQHGWTIESRHGGLSRRYRDPRFDSLTSETVMASSSCEHTHDCTELQSASGQKEVKPVIGLLILIAAVLAALPALGQFLRVMTTIIIRLMTATFLITLAIIVLVALVAHGLLG
jgi:hypothetical protein